MEYNRIVAVTGLPGLYEIISSKSDGAIVRSLDDKTTRFVSSRIHNLSHLESIEVYTVRENVQLSDIFIAMKEAGGPLPDVKDAGAVRSYFEKAYPELDFERVYGSDMKKMVKWYEVLNANEIDFTATSGAQEEEGEEAEAPADAAAGEPAAGPAQKKAPAKKAPARKEAAPQKEAAAKKEAPAKKEAAPKKAAPKKEAAAKKEAAPKKAAAKKEAAPKKSGKK